MWISANPISLPGQERTWKRKEPEVKNTFKREKDERIEPLKSMWTHTRPMKTRNTVKSKVQN